jgi:hypothetical protein
VFCSIKPEVEKSKMAAARPGKTWNAYISSYMWDRNEINKATRTFYGSSDPKDYSVYDTPKP